MSRRALKNEIRRRKFLPSFGDIILPVVGLVGIGLLGLAGWNFFIGGIKPAPEIPVNNASYIMHDEELILKNEVDDTSENLNNSNANANINVNVNKNISEPNNNLNYASAQKTQDEIKQENIPPVSNLQAEPVKVNAVKNTAEMKDDDQPDEVVQDFSHVNTFMPSNRQWRVQIGAFGSKEAAQAAANKITRMGLGYRATTFANPASKHVRVWVLAGESKAYAESILQRMKNSGYPSSFMVSPSK